MSVKNMCHEGHIWKENARSFYCPQCRRNETRRKEREARPEKIANEFVQKGTIWVGSVVPLSDARCLARAYLSLMKEMKIRGIR